MNTTFECMVEKVCEPQRTSPRSDWSQKPATLGSNQWWSLVILQRWLQERWAEDQLRIHRSLWHMLTLYLRNLPVKHLRRMEFPGGHHRKPQKKHCCVFEACKSAPGCLTALPPSLTEQFIPTFIGTFCRKTINTSNEAQLRVDVATGHWPEDVKQQQKCFNKRKCAFWSGPESRPRDAVAKHSSPPEKMNEPKRFCKEERSKIPPDREAGVIWLRSALPKQSQPVNEIQNFNVFSTLYLKIYRLFNKNMKSYHFWCVLSLSKLCLFKVS